MSSMTLFFQLIIMLLGLATVTVFGSKGFFSNLILAILIMLTNEIANLKQIIYLMLFATTIYFLAEYVNKMARKKYDSLPIREMVLGGTAISILAGMVIRPIFSGAMIGPILGVPLLRRIKKLGYKAILLSFGSFLLRFVFSLILNVYVIVNLL